MKVNAQADAAQKKLLGEKAEPMCRRSAPATFIQLLHRPAGRRKFKGEVMGSGKKYEVHVWSKWVDDEYFFVMVLATNSIIRATLRALIERHKGFGCVKIELRDI